MVFYCGNWPFTIGRKSWKRFGISQTKSFWNHSFEIKEGKKKSTIVRLNGTSGRNNKNTDFQQKARWIISKASEKNTHHLSPRVDTTYLSENFISKIFWNSQEHEFYSDLTAPLLEAPIPMSKSRFWWCQSLRPSCDYPNEIPPTSNLTREEKISLWFGGKAFHCGFYPECKISNTLVEGQVGTINFKASGKQILEPGWRLVYKRPKDTTEKRKNGRTTYSRIYSGRKKANTNLCASGKNISAKTIYRSYIAESHGNRRKTSEDEELRELLKNNGIRQTFYQSKHHRNTFKKKIHRKEKEKSFRDSNGIDLIDTIEDELLKVPN